MSDLAIECEGLGKRYRLGPRAPYHRFTDLITALVSSPLRQARALGRDPGEGARGNEKESIWAVRDLSFRVERGETVGIIGRNGAGKSTLLKVLSRITEPTRGTVRVRGRVGSLLEVGTGFHHELTGRENIYLNGTILGMKRAEITRKFDQIVGFAEVERFLDTPVKHYSSGMYTRLAFAVAAHLETEILIVDEVLAVGDASFQKKCLSKMEEVGGEGRTVLFVSHNIQAVTRLCPRCILLDQGRLVQDGPAEQVIHRYLLAGIGVTAERRWEDPSLAPGNEIGRLRAVRVRSEDGRVTARLDIRRPIGIEMEYDVLQDRHVLVPNFHLYNEQGSCVFVVADTSPEWRRRLRPAGHYATTAWIPGNLLAEGSIVVHAALSTMDPLKVHFNERDAVAFQVVDSLDGDSARGDYAGPMPGVVRPLLDWTTQFVPAPAAAVVPNTVKEPNG